ncbi:MAG: hypothetical protein KC933_07490 [Myxococcales bacterium]|nr:hypothetical protein [Myxococcales bacterium]
MGSRLSVGFVAVALVAGCDEGATLQYSPPFLTASTVDIDFGTRDVGTTEERTVFLLNKGETPLKLQEPVGDPLSGVFVVRLDVDVVQPEDEALLTIRFSPFDPQPYETTFRIANDSANEKELEIRIHGIGKEPDPCARVNCIAAPPPVCITQDTSRRYEPLGVCEAGRCNHDHNDETCERGCDDATGTCRGDPCAGVVCNTPPSGCYFAQGTCREGACEYMVNNAGTCDDNKPCTTGDRCQEGMCVGDQTVCDTPPDALCLDASTRRFWNAQGTCNMQNGACEYMQQDQQCPFGCQDGACLGDPCIGVVCNTPPSGQCFEQMGTCTNGVCQYGTVPGSCNDADPCTSNDTCNNGACTGTPQACTTPPAAVCTGSNMLEVYDMAGTCSGGACEYTASTITCDDNDVCTVGDNCAAGACRSGALNPCNDGNACTADSCDPVGGCVHTPISGSACTTNSAECPTGTCSAGTCLPTAGVACVATYEVCLGLIDQDVAGVCSGSGECVVSQAPPQFICPGCNGLCFTCLGVQICIPF